jgi:hypothetical protein
MVPTVTMTVTTALSVVVGAIGQRRDFTPQAGTWPLGRDDPGRRSASRPINVIGRGSRLDVRSNP